MPMRWEPTEITFRARDFENVKSFYKAVLALRVIEDEPESYVKFELGTLSLRLERFDDTSLPEDYGKAMQLYFKVRSTRDILEVLNKLNVDYNLQRFSDGVKLDISDPEGRIITFLSKY